MTDNFYPLGFGPCRLLAWDAAATDNCLCEFVTDRASYYVTDAFHGEPDGSLWFELPGGAGKLTPPEKVRRYLELYFQIDLDPQRPIWILPCYPKQVNAFQGQDLAGCGVFVAGDWNDITYVSREATPKGVSFQLRAKQANEKEN